MIKFNREEQNAIRFFAEEYGVEWDEKYLEQMTAEAVEEINEQYNARERLFEEEKICYIASELQYEAVA